MSALGIANPAGALGFLALAALVLLYLRARRRRPIPVATLFLWQRVQAPLVEARRFRPDLLFVLQAALLALLAAGLLRPYVERPAAAAPPARLLLVLDVSASMQAREPDGVRFELARARAQTELAALDAGGEAMLLAAGARTTVALRWSADRALARRRLEETVPLDVPTDLAPALELALGETRARPDTRVVVLTDLPPADGGVDAHDLDAVDWIRVGRSDDNVGIAGLVLETPPFADASAASLVAVVRNYAAAPRRVALDAFAGGARWRRQELTLAARASVTVSLGAPPAAGAVELALEGDDALAVDDHAWTWLAAQAPFDAVVATRSPALGAALGRLAATVHGGTVTVVAPEAWTPEVAAGHRLAVLDGFVPPALPAVPGTLYLAPPPGDGVCPAAGTAEQVTVVDWDGDHPLLHGLDDLPSLTVTRASTLGLPSWGTPVIVAGTHDTSFPLLVVGERDGRRIACLGAALAEELLESDRLPLLLATLATLRWLDASGTPLAVTTGVAVDAPAGAAAAAGVRVAGDPPVLIAERVGIHHLATPVGERIVAANLFDERESDIGRRETPAIRRAAGRARVPATARHDVAPWLFAAGFAALVVEWGLWARRAGR